MRLLPALLPAALLLAGLAGSGCATGPVAPPPPAQGAAIVRATVATGATLALNKNPAYAAAAQALADGIGVALGSDLTLTPELISAFVRQVCARHGMPPNDAAVFVTLALNVYHTYAAAYRAPLPSVADPTARLYLAAFRDGIADALLAAAPQP